MGTRSLGEDRVIGPLQPAQQLPGDPLVVGPVLPVAAVWQGERERADTGNVVFELPLAPLDVPERPLAPFLEALPGLAVGVERAEVFVAGPKRMYWCPSPEWSWSSQRPLS